MPDSTARVLPSISSLSGQAGVVSSIVNATASPSMTIDLTMSSVTMSRPSSGSWTARRASSTAPSVMTVMRSRDLVLTQETSISYRDRQKRPRRGLWRRPAFQRANEASFGCVWNGRHAPIARRREPAVGRDRSSRQSERPGAKPQVTRAALADDLSPDDHQVEHASNDRCVATDDSAVSQRRAAIGPRQRRRAGEELRPRASRPASASGRSERSVGLVALRDRSDWSAAAVQRVTVDRHCARGGCPRDWICRVGLVPDRHASSRCRSPRAASNGFGSAVSRIAPLEGGGARSRSPGDLRGADAYQRAGARRDGRGRDAARRPAGARPTRLPQAARLRCHRVILLLADTRHNRAAPCRGADAPRALSDLHPGLPGRSSRMPAIRAATRWCSM